MNVRLSLLTVLLTCAAVFLGGCAQPNPTPSPELAAKLASLCVAEGSVRCYPAPNQQAVLKVDAAAGSVDYFPVTGETRPLLAAGGNITEASWSPDSRRFVLAQAGIAGPAKLLSSAIENQIPGEPQAVYTSAPAEGNAALVLGDWSPDSRYLLFWDDPLMSASILADGTPARVWDSLSGTTQLITPPGDYGPSTVALSNPGYHSWAPDSSALAITLGGYRSAQANKWLALVRPDSGAGTVAITNTEQIPGLVAWSPKGDLIAYAAVPADAVTPETVDGSTLDSPAVAARRIYLYEAQSGEHYRLENTESFQDAPLWSRNGTMLYYVQQEGDQVVLMVADFYGGVFAKIPGASMPVADAQSYYGQFDWQPLLSKATP